MKNIMTSDDIKAFDTPYKIALVATTDERGDAHISLLSTLMARTESEMMFGRFIVGKSKEYLAQRPEAGFLIMTLDKDFWTGQMRYTRTLSSGAEYEKYNSHPLFRYNTYFGVDSVFVCDLLNISDKRRLNMPAVIFNAIRVLAAKPFRTRKDAPKLLTPWADGLMKKLDTLAFIAWVDEKGVPAIAPCIQLQSADAATLVLTDSPYKELLSQIRPDSRVAVFGANLKFESVLMKGRFTGWHGGLGSVEIDRVYNSMPPKHGVLAELRAD